MYEQSIMQQAIIEAKKAYKKGDVPIGAIIVKDGKIISRAYNKKEKKNVATYHAEILAIQKATKKLHTWHLDECTMYVTLEPCMMCSGAIIQSRIKKIYYLADNINNGFLKSKYDLTKMYNIRIEQINSILKTESIHLLKTFFQQRRK